MEKWYPNGELILTPKFAFTLRQRNVEIGASASVTSFSRLCVVDKQMKRPVNMANPSVDSTAADVRLTVVLFTIQTILTTATLTSSPFTLSSCVLQCSRFIHRCVWRL